MGVDFVVIIPCYRRFDLLEKCVATVPDAPSIQVLIIDDASPIEDFEAFKLKMAGRNNVKLFQNAENHGAGYSRNFGLKYARDNIRGEGKQWIVFSDDDDAFTEDAFDIFQSHKDSTADIIYFQADFVDYRENKDAHCFVYFNDKNKAIKRCFKKGDSKYLRIKGGEPWAKMFSKAFIEENNLLFPEIQISEDLFFISKAGFCARQIEAFEQKVYVYGVFEKSGSRQRTFEKWLIDLNERCAANALYLSRKGYFFHLYDVLLASFRILRIFGYKNHKTVFGILKKHGLLSSAIRFYCVNFVYRAVTFIPRRISRRIKQSRYKV